MPAPKQRKVAVVGSRSVGKSSLTVQFVEGHFVESYYPTIENTFSRVIRHNGQDYATEIVDTAGQRLLVEHRAKRKAALLQDEYSIMSSKHFIGIHGYVLVYSVASRQSFDTVRVIIEKILNHLGESWAPMAIVGNKSDLKPELRQVPAEEGEQLARTFNCSFTEASARLNSNVARAFELVVSETEKSRDPNKPTGGNKCCMM